MKLDPDTVLRKQEPSESATAAGHGWPAAAGLTLVLIAALLVLYRDTALSIVAIWDRSETFAHGFLVLPVVAYLVWTKRHALIPIRPEPTYAGLAALLLIGFGWLAAELAQVQVVRQFALAAMIPAAVLTVLGWRVARVLAFPLAFLFMGVPFGEAFIPPLMNFTADFTVAMLQLNGIPVYREGTFFTIPSGQWSVVEGCSGLRYLIASIFAGTLYAYLTYRTWKKRAIFTALAVVVPIIANGFRAYMIVMIAHLSDMRLALGVDHFIYGWVWFGIVMMLMFWIGSYWRDPDSDEQARAPSPTNAMPVRLAPLGVAAAAVALAAGVWPAYAAYLDQRSSSTPSATIKAPAGAGGWTLDETPVSAWKPHYQGADATLLGTYRKGERAVLLYVGYYRQQRQGAELVNSQNVMIPQQDSEWSNVGESGRTERLSAEPVKIRQTLLRGPGQRLLIWDWFRLSGVRTSSAPLAKLLLARDRLLAASDDGAAIILATPYDTRKESAEEVLREYIADMLPAIEASIREAERS